MKMRSMKSFVSVLLCALCLSVSASKSLAQARPSPYTNDISVGLISLLEPLGYVSLQYEWKAAITNSWVVRAYLPKADEGYSGFGVGGAYKFFIADSRALTGLSVAPAAEIFFLSNSGTSRSATPILIGGDVAYKWIFGQFSVEPIAYVRIGILSGTGPAAYSGVGAGIDVLLGFAF
jgi:hypothetical protein